MKIGMTGMPENNSGGKKTVSDPIFNHKTSGETSGVSISKPKMVSDNPIFAELGISLDKPLKITPELAKKLQKKGEIGFLESLKEGWTNSIPFGGTAIEIAKNVNLLAIVQKMDEKGFDSLSKEDRETLILFQFKQAEKENRGTSILGQVGGGLTHLPAIAVEFMATGGTYTLGAKASQKLLTTEIEETTYSITYQDGVFAFIYDYPDFKFLEFSDGLNLYEYKSGLKKLYLVNGKLIEEISEIETKPAVNDSSIDDLSQFDPNNDFVVLEIGEHHSSGRIISDVFREIAWKKLAEKSKLAFLRTLKKGEIALSSSATKYNVIKHERKLTTKTQKTVQLCELKICTEMRIMGYRHPETGEYIFDNIGKDISGFNLYADNFFNTHPEIAKL